MQASLAFLIRTTLVLMALACCGAQQPRIVLRIDSPADGTVVHPGQTISVRVSSPEGVAVKTVFVLPENPVEVSEMATSLPATFSIKVPADIASARKYMVTAVGSSRAGELLMSPTILIDVEPPDSSVKAGSSKNAQELQGGPAVIAKIASSIEQLIFESQGQQWHLLLLATLADGRVIEVTESSRLRFRSLNSSVATVDANGVVTAVATGSGMIVVTYRDGNREVEGRVPVRVQRGALTALPATLKFGADGGIVVGGTAAAEITLTNTTMSDNLLRITNIVATGDYSETNNCVSSSPLAVGATCRISVRFSPIRAYSRSGSLTIYNSASGVPMVISLTGFAAPN